MGRLDLVVRKAEFEPGMYRMKLKNIESVEKKVYDFKAKQMTEETEPAVRFLFIEPRTKIELSHDVRAIVAAKSGLVKLAKSMGGKLFTDAVCKDRDKFETILFSLIGREFLVNLDVNDEGSWNKVTAILPTEGAQQEIPTSVRDEDSDIPF